MGPEPRGPVEAARSRRRSPLHLDGRTLGSPWWYPCGSGTTVRPRRDRRARGRPRHETAHHRLGADGGLRPRGRWRVGARAGREARDLLLVDHWRRGGRAPQALRARPPAASRRGDHQRHGRRRRRPERQGRPEDPDARRRSARLLPGPHGTGADRHLGHDRVHGAARRPVQGSRLGEGVPPGRPRAPPARRGLLLGSCEHPPRQRALVQPQGLPGHRAPAAPDRRRVLPGRRQAQGRRAHTPRPRRQRDLGLHPPVRDGLDRHPRGRRLPGALDGQDRLERPGREEGAGVDGPDARLREQRPRRPELGSGQRAGDPGEGRHDHHGGLGRRGQPGQGVQGRGLGRGPR